MQMRIIAKTDKGGAVFYKSTRITGDLDMTQLKNQTIKRTPVTTHRSRLLSYWLLPA